MEGTRKTQRRLTPYGAHRDDHSPPPGHRHTSRREAMAEGHHIDFGVGARVTVCCFCLEQTLSGGVVEVGPIEQD